MLIFFFLFGICELDYHQNIMVSHICGLHSWGPQIHLINKLFPWEMQLAVATFCINVDLNKIEKLKHYGGYESIY